MEKPFQITKQEEICLSLSPFTLPALFYANLQDTIHPYLTPERCMLLPKGFCFYETGQTADRLFFLSKGIVIETLLNENALEKNFLIFPSYLVGMNYCAHGQPIFPCTRAFTKCEVYMFLDEEFLSLVQQNKELLNAVISTFAIDFRLANCAFLQNQSCSTYEKICQTILSYFIASKYVPQIKHLTMTQTLIAGLSGVHRISVVHAIQKLKQEQIITYEKKKLVLLDEEKLMTIAYGKYPIP